MKKRMVRKAAALLLLAGLLLGVLPGCGKTPVTQDTTALTESTQPGQPELELDDMSALQAVTAFAQDQGIPVESYPKHIIALLEANPETREFVLGYPFEYGMPHEIDLSEYIGSETVPLFMQWDKRWGYIRYGSDLAGITACGPVCLSMVAFHLTGDPSMSPDRIIHFALENGYCIPGNGSAWTLISEGGKKLGLGVQELQLSQHQILESLEQGHPVICIMGPGIFTSSGHYVVIVGSEDGMLRINDPNSREKSNRLWSFDEIKDQIRNLWSISLS